MIDQMYDKTRGVWVDVDPHQHVAYAHLMCNPRAILWLGMSLSKTVIALTYLHDMHYAEVAFLKTLVIAPDKVARITWPEELAKWQHLDGTRYSVISGDAKQRAAALAADAEIYIIGVDNLSWLLDQYIYKRVSKQTGAPYGPWLGSLPFDSVLIDELSLFKGRGSGRFKKLRTALEVSKTPNRVGMTGTFVPNGYIDAWAQAVLIDGGARLGPTFGEFLDEFFTTRGNGQIVFEYRAKPWAAKVIAHRLRDITLSLNTRDIIELPDLILHDVELNFSPFDRDTYEELEEQYCLDLFNQDGESEVTIKTPADLTNKLLQLTSGAIYEDDTRKNWYELNTLKLDALGEILEANPDENFIVVYQYRHEIDRIVERFPYARQIRKGKNSLEDFRAWNAREIRLLLIHPKSAGHGLNLQYGGSSMVWFSLTWNLEYWEQTIARLLRRGVLSAVNVYRLIVKGTRDVKVKKRVEIKQTDQNFLQNEVKELRAKYRQKIY